MKKANKFLLPLVSKCLGLLWCQDGGGCSILLGCSGQGIFDFVLIQQEQVQGLVDAIAAATRGG